MNYFKRFETAIIIVIILVLGLAYGILNKSTVTDSKKAAESTQPQATANQNDGQVLIDDGAVATEVPAGLIRYPGQDGKNALEILKSLHRVETQNFAGVGEFVKSINGVAPDSSHFWSFYVNGQQSQVGADAYVTKSSDNIEWKLEEIK